jgi:hypothetical protein
MGCGKIADAYVAEQKYYVSVIAETLRNIAGLRIGLPVGVTPPVPP